MWPEVLVSAVAERWRPLSDEETVVAATRIKDAQDEVQLQLRNRGVLAPPVGDALWADTYVRTIADMVRRYLLNPDAWLEETERIDDYQSTMRRDSAVSAGLIYVSEDEIAKLIPMGRRKRGAFSIVLGAS